jgi:hypothetical protein
VHDDLAPWLAASTIDLVSLLLPARTWLQSKNIERDMHSSFSEVGQRISRRAEDGKEAAYAPAQKPDLGLQKCCDASQPGQSKDKHQGHVFLAHTRHWPLPTWMSLKEGPTYALGWARGETGCPSQLVWYPLLCMLRIKTNQHFALRSRPQKKNLLKKKAGFRGLFD